jgi:hypothetical protein
MVERPRRRHSVAILIGWLSVNLMHISPNVILSVTRPNRSEMRIGSLLLIREVYYLVTVAVCVAEYGVG